MPARPVLILQDSRGFPPGYLGDVLARAGRPAVALRVDGEDDVPDRGLLGRIAGLALMGGEDPDRAPATRLGAETDFVRAALDAGLPVLAHGPASAILSRAAGGPAERPPATEIGWQPLSLTATAAGSDWLGVLRGGPHLGFMDHVRGCDAPPGAQVLLASTRSRCQLFVSGRAIGVLFHPEITPAAFADWLARRGGALPPAGLSVQTRDEMAAGAPARIRAGRALATALYAAWTAWIDGVAPAPQRRNDRDGRGSNQ